MAKINETPGVQVVVECNTVGCGERRVVASMKMGDVTAKGEVGFTKCRVCGTSLKCPRFFISRMADEDEPNNAPNGGA